MGLDRSNLFRQLSTLPEGYFNGIVFALAMPIELRPPANLPQGERATRLLEWAESAGAGLGAVQTELDSIQGKTSAPDAAICPYKGLSYFDFTPQDSDLFCGRQALITQLVEKATAATVLAVVGASGSGKSSVVRAGLLPRLKAKDNPEIHILLPGAHPLSSLASAFVDPDSSLVSRAKKLDEAEEFLRKTSGLTSLVKVTNADQIVLVIDQFEEVFTLCNDDRERDHFFAVLMAAAQAEPQRLRLIFTMRSEFLGRCLEQEYSGLAQAIQANLVSVWPMNEQQLRQAITEPARRAGLAVEPLLVTEILKDVQTATSSLPLVQYTLKELWKRRQNDTLTLKTYAELGGVRGTLQRRADAVCDAKNMEGQEGTVRHIFLSLTRLGEGTEDTRRRVLKANLVTPSHSREAIDTVLGKLVAANLVVTGDAKLVDPAKDLDETEEWGKTTVEVTHEALIRHWPQLQGWLEESRDGLRQQRRVEGAAQEWDNNGRQPGYLLQGLGLKNARAAMKSEVGLQLSDLATTFVQASRRSRRIAQAKILGLALVFPFLGSAFMLHLLYVDRARNIFQANGCDADPGVVAMLNYMHRTGYKNELRKINLCGEELRGLSLPGSTLEGAVFDDANLPEADLRGSQLANSKFRGAFMYDTKFQGSVLSHADFSCLEDSTNPIENCANLTNANFDGTDLTDTNFYGANLANANFDNADLTGANLASAIGLTPESLEKSTLCNTLLPNELEISGDRDCQSL